MTCMEITSILDKKDVKYCIVDNNIYIADTFMDEIYFIRVRIKGGKYSSHRAYGIRYNDIEKKGAQWDCSHHSQTLHSGLPFRVSKNLQSLLEAIDK